MTFIDAIILGVVEGMTEFLPVSSTGHLILSADLLGLPETDFLATFQVAIQLGAILAVVLLYWKKLFLDRQIMLRIIVALLPAIGVGFLFYSSIKELFASEMTVVATLFLGGIAIIAFEMLRKDKEGVWDDLSVVPYKTALAIGFFQALAVIPGVSRAGATIIGGLMMGLKRAAIVEFSFLLAVPTMVAATAIDLYNHADSFSTDDFGILSIGFVTSFLVAILAIKFFIRYVQTHTFIPFGIYRIVIALIFFFFIL